MSENQYGKISNGILMKAPLQMYDEDTFYQGVPDRIYRKYGYKPLIFEPQPAIIPRDVQPKYYWEEQADCIKQTWCFEDLPDSYEEQLRNSKGRFNIALSKIRNNLNEYCAQKKQYMDLLIHQDPIVEKAYKNIRDQEENVNIAQAMKKYQHRVPENFFNVIDISNYLISEGYYINTQHDILFFSYEGKVFTNEQMELLDFRAGKVYEKDTGIQLYPVSKYSAIKCHDDKSIKIIDPIQVMFHLQDIVSAYNSFHEPNLYFSMVYVYLHTIMDVFMNSLIRFCVCVLPEKNKGTIQRIDTVDMQSINSMEELIDCKNKIIDDCVIQIVHKGYYTGKVKYLLDIGLNFTLDESMWKHDMIWFCVRRNLIVHNEAIMNNKAIKKLRGTCYENTVSVGENVTPNCEELRQTIDLVDSVCNDIYNVAKQKFRF